MKYLDIFPEEEILSIKEEPVISISQRLSVEDINREKNQTRLSNLLSEGRELAKEKYSSEVAEKILNQLDEVEKNMRELILPRGGLLIYATLDEIYYTHTAIPVDNTVTVGHLPYLLPLITNYQFSHNYHLLVLNQNEISLYRGRGRELEKIEFPEDDAPKTLEDALGTEKVGGELTHGTYGSPGTGGHQSFHGHNETSSEKEIDRINYFRVIDKYIYENYSRHEEIPLILYATPDNQAVFRDITDNQYLLEEGIEKDGSRATIKELEEATFEFDQRLVQQEKDELFELFDETSPNYLIENDPAQLARAVVEGRIETLVVNEAKDVKGRINDDGTYEENEDDYYRHLITRALQSKADVFVVMEDFFGEDDLDFTAVARLRY